MKKNGFTLIELLVVIGLISLLMIMFMPSLLNASSNVKNNTYSNKVNLIEVAAENYIEDNMNAIKGNSSICVTIEYLIQNGYLISDNTDGTYLLNPSTNTKMTGKALLEYYQDSSGIWRAKATYSDNPSCYTIIESQDEYSNKYQVSNMNPPTGNSIIINDGASKTVSLDVKLTLANTSNTATTMCISNTTSCVSWQAFDTIVPHWTLDSTNGSSTKTVYAWFKDSNGLSSTSVYDTIVYDSGPPKITFTPITNGSYQKNSTVSVLFESVSNITNIRYAWLSNKVTDLSTLGSVYSFTSATSVTASFTNSTLTGTYYLCAYAKNASNYVTTACSNQFYFDNTGPSISVTGAYTTAKSHTPTLTASDTYTGVSILKYKWSNSTSTSASDGITISSGAIIPTYGTVTGTYYLWVYAVDGVGNISSTYYAYYYDNTAPIVSSFLINNGASTTNSAYVTLNSSVTGASQACFSNSYNGGVCNGSWETYTTARANWYLGNTASGSYIVYAWYRDASLNVSGPISDLITLSSAIYPSGSVTINGGAYSTTSSLVTLSISYSNAVAMCVSTSYGGCSPSSALASTYNTYIAGYANTDNYIYVTLISSTGNTVIVSDSIYYSVPVSNPPVITTNLSEGGYYPAGTTVITYCNSSGSNITNLYVYDDSYRFGMHGLDDGDNFGGGTYMYNIIYMASATSIKCNCSSTCSYLITAQCSNSAGTTYAYFHFEIGVTSYNC